VIEFALGFLCASVVVSLIWWRTEPARTGSQNDTITMNSESDNKNKQKSSFLQGITTSKPDNRAGRVASTPQHIREMEELVTKTPVEDDYV